MSEEINQKSLVQINHRSAGEEDENGGVSRRGFLKILGAASAVGAAGCADSPSQKIISHVKGQTDQVPGVSTWYSSTCQECTAGCGIAVRNVDGRIVKVEGNSSHPINGGGLCGLGQSSLQALYDPDRVRQPMQWVDDDSSDERLSISERVKKMSGQRVLKPISWKAAFKKIGSQLAKSGGKAAFIGGETTGTYSSLVEKFCSGLGIDRAVYDPLQQSAIAEASELVYGHFGIPGYHLDKADVVLNFGADFLETWISPVEFASAWAKGRRKQNPTRYIHVEPRLSLTGSNADTWYAAKPGTEVHLALAICKLLLKSGKGRNLAQEVRQKIWPLLKGVTVSQAAKKTGIEEEKILMIAHRLGEARHGLVLAGGAAASTTSAKELQVAAALLNLLLGSVGTTVNLSQLRKPQSSVEKVMSVVDKISSGGVDVLIVHGANPAYDLPTDSNFEYALKKVKLKVSISSHLDETARLADIILPSHHSLEDWGDSQPKEGVYSFIQPAMTPVFDTKSAGDIILELAIKAGKEGVAAGVSSYEEYLKNHWRAIHSSLGIAEDFSAWMRKVQKQGGHFVQTDSRVKVSVSDELFSLKLNTGASFNKKGLGHDSQAFFPFPSVKTFDGRAANRPWLQELPDPITQIVWDSWAEIHPTLAKKKGIKQGDLVTVRNSSGELKVPAYVTEFVHPDVIAVPLGQGHTGYGRYAQEVSSRGNAFSLLSVSSGAALLSQKVSVKRSLGSGELVITQGSSSQFGRELARTEHVEERGHEDHGHGHGGHHEPKQMFEQRKHPLYEWGLSVDLATCTGCSACVVACYAENNIATVGKEICKQGRVMSWLRIERYFDSPDGGDAKSMEELEVSFLPMMCQQCNNAPCEPVCPVFATLHNEEGLNVMAYNRCVGTRYCSNNCSYKVRRYNWFEYEFPEPMNLQLNPDVTKRSGGVMEKCSFCIHRIASAKDRAKDLGRLVEDGDVQPACVQGCPTQALTFGNLNDPNSQVSKQAKNSRAYKVLDHHLNTQPSVTYLSNVRYKEA